MTVSDYATSFGYNATDGTYYYLPTASHPKTSDWVGNRHRGNDHPAPLNTPLVIGDVTLGYSGATGAAAGPHCHVQAGTDKACQNDIDPTPLEFKPGTVVTTGNASQWGNYITVQVGNQYVTYCHLNKINVSVGDKVGEDMAKFTKAQEQTAAIMATGSVPGDNYNYPFTVEDISSDELDAFLQTWQGRMTTITKEMETAVAEGISGMKGYIGKDYNSQFIGKPVVSHYPAMVNFWISQKPSQSGSADAADAAKYRQIKSLLGE